MVCPRCSAINRVEARFCRACGAPLSRKTPIAPEPTTSDSAALAAPHPVTGALLDQAAATAAPDVAAATPAPVAGDASATVAEGMATGPGEDGATLAPVDLAEPLNSATVPEEPQVEAGAARPEAAVMEPPSLAVDAATEPAAGWVAAPLPAGESPAAAEAAAPGQAVVSMPEEAALQQPEAVAPQTGGIDAVAATTPDQAGPVAGPGAAPEPTWPEEAAAGAPMSAGPEEAAVAAPEGARPEEAAAPQGAAPEEAAAAPESELPGPSQAAGPEAGAPEGMTAVAPESSLPMEAETRPSSSEAAAPSPSSETAAFVEPAEAAVAGSEPPPPVLAAQGPDVTLDASDQAVLPPESVLPLLGVPDAGAGPFAVPVAGAPVLAGAPGEPDAEEAAPPVPAETPTAPLPVSAGPVATPPEPPPFAPDAAGETPAEPPPFAPDGLEASPAMTASTAAESAPEDGGPPDERATSHLDSDEAPVPAPPVPGEAFPALQPGALVAGRYLITEVLQTGPQRQSYLAQDQQGYLRCWSCGSRDNVQGELYCTNCGAQLTGRTYRLLETPPEAPLGDLPAPLVENQVPGLALMFDAPSDSETGRHYLVLEDVGGQPLSAWTSAEAKSAGPVPDERVLGVLSQAADRLQALHAAGIVGCDFTPQALHVLADDRLVLADPSACRLGGTAGSGSDPGAAAQADVQRVAAALEQWYAEVRPDEEPPAAGETGTAAGVLARGREGAYRTAAQFAGAAKALLALSVVPHDLQLVSGRATDVGVQRSLNEDSLFALECVAMEAAGSTPVGIYVVADGMGGHESGEVASSIAIRTIAGKLTGIVEGRLTGEQPDIDADARRQLVRGAILEANGRITRLSQERGSDMGTTVTMAVVLGNQATVANVGDSRTYLWRDGKLQQITQDHSLVARLVAAGQITAEEGLHFDRRNEIYRALGDAHLTADEIDVFQVALRPLDALLLCSDGLWEMVRDAQIEQILLDASDVVVAAQNLIERANQNGGEDNISVIIVQTLTSLDG